MREFTKILTKERKEEGHTALSVWTPTAPKQEQYQNAYKTVIKPLSVLNSLGHMRGAQEDRAVLPLALLLSFSTYEMKRNGRFVGCHHSFWQRKEFHVSSGTLWLINIKCLWVTTRNQLCLLLPFSPRRCDVMSDKRQRARVQGSWAQQVPKHAGRTGHFRDDGYCRLTSACYSLNEIIICICTYSSPGCWYLNILCLAKTFTKTFLSVNVPDVENNFWFLFFYQVQSQTTKNPKASVQPLLLGDLGPRKHQRHLSFSGPQR